MSDIPWLVFLTVSIAVIVAPGQDMILVMSRGIGQGAIAGIVTGAGVSAGLVVHSALAALGLGTLLATSAFAYEVLKYIGAAYLAYLGIRLLMSANEVLKPSIRAKRSAKRLFVEAAISNLSNPKIILFYLAFLPQFVPTSSPDSAGMIFLLGISFALLTFAIKAPVGLFSGALSSWFRAHPRTLAWIIRGSGFTLILLGVRLILEPNRSQ